MHAFCKVMRQSLRSCGPSHNCAYALWNIYAGLISGSAVLCEPDTTRHPKPKLRDLEHVNLHEDLGKCRRQRSHVLTTRHRPERRPSRPVKIIDTQRGTRSALAPGPSVYVLTPISGVFPGHCPFSADTPT